MCLGTLETQLVLNEPDKIHYGSGSTIAGRVVLTYRRPIAKRSKGSRPPESAIPLFGPLVIDVVLQGILKVRVSERGNAGMDFKDDSVFLTTTQRVHDGAFFIKPGESLDVAFVMTTPASIDSRVETRTQCRRDSAGSWHFSNVSQTIEAAPLPPSCKTLNRKGAGDRSLASIEYLLEARTIMPGIDVRIEPIPLQPGGSPLVHVLYECARPAQPPLGSTIYMGSHVSVSPSRITSSSERPQGFKSKARALLRTSGATQPVEFELFCSQIPREMCLGAKLQCCVGVRATAHGQGGDNTGIALPEIRLDRLTAHIVQYTSVHADKRWGTKERPKDVQVVQMLAATPTTLPVILRPAAGNTTTVTTISTAECLHGMSSSFALGPITRSYKLRLELQIACADEVRTARRDFDLTIYPPVADDDDDDDDIEILSRAMYANAGILMAADERLPGYGEAMNEPSPPLDEFAVERTLANPPHYVVVGA